VTTVLEVKGLSVSYGQHRALEDVSVRVEPGEITVILGANGAGKSTLLKAVAGICEGSASGLVEMEGQPLLGLPPHRIVAAGITLVPEGRGLFADLTVRENLLLGAYTDRARSCEQVNLDGVFGLFPQLVERQKQVVRTMSGGEQQMVAIGRAMMTAPAILMLDEPSLGLSPLLCRELFHSLVEVRKSGIGILLVEQNAKQSLAVADRGYLLENAQIMGQDTAANLAGDPKVQRAYLGVSGDAAPAVVHEPRANMLPEPPEPGAAVEPRFTMDEVGRHAVPPRARSDDLIGESIDDLVQRAAAQEADRAGQADIARPPAERPAPNPESPAATNGSGRLRQVLAEIEQAAADARLGPSEPVQRVAPQARQGNGATDPDKRSEEPESFDDRSTIEIYRRKPGPDGNDRLVRVKGDEHG
jgi:branched-chain amino acid transport system ATP-binding protein